MAKIAFTICSINYLAQAQALGDSLKKHNPNYKFIIGLVDILERSSVDRSKLPNYEILEISELKIDGFDDMYDRYNITELNTAVKPFFIQYFYDQNPDAISVIYFDPDIEIFQSLDSIDNSLENHSLVLTPHILSPYNDTANPKERDVLNVGIFNLGFIGTSRCAETMEFLKWWQQKLKFECYVDLKNGMFVDQLWVDFAPIYWQNVLIDRHLGYNMAYWNLHERTLTGQTPNYSVNNNEPLVFFHYSGFNPLKPEKISKYQDRHTFETNPDVKPLFESYTAILQKNEYEYFQQFACAYMKTPEAWVPPKRGQRPRKLVINALHKLADITKNI